MNPTNLPLAQARADSAARLSYYLPRRSYWHFCVRQGMRRLGFKVLCVIKLDHHHVWDMRLRTSGKVSENGVRRLRRELRKLCAIHGPPIKAKELTIVRNGSLLELAFIWPVGEPGLFDWHCLQVLKVGKDVQEPSSSN